MVKKELKNTMKARLVKKINKKLSKYRPSTIDEAMRKYNKLLKRGNKWRITRQFVKFSNIFKLVKKQIGSFKTTNIAVQLMKESLSAHASQHDN